MTYSFVLFLFPNWDFLKELSMHYKHHFLELLKTISSWDFFNKKKKWIFGEV